MDVAEIASLPVISVRQLARVERVSPFISSMVTAATLGFTLVISRLISPQATDQQVESTGHGEILDGGLA
jgi:hypothetical protein